MLKTLALGLAGSWEKGDTSKDCEALERWVNSMDFPIDFSKRWCFAKRWALYALTIGSRFISLATEGGRDGCG